MAELLEEARTQRALRGAKPDISNEPNPDITKKLYKRKIVNADYVKWRR
jgi:hypothetical protein